SRREERDGAAIEQAHAAGGVGDVTAREKIVQRGCDQPDSEPPQPRGAKASIVDKATSDDDVRAPPVIGFEQGLDLPRIMLAIAVDLDAEIIRVACGIFD